MNLKKNKYLEHFLPFWTLLSGYMFGGVGFDLVVLLGLAFIALKRHNFKLCLRSEYKIYFIFWIYIMIKDIMSVIIGQSDSSVAFHRFIVYSIQFALIYIVCNDGFDEEELYKVWKIAGIIYVVGLLIQLVQIVVFKQGVTGISLIPGYSFSNTNEPLRPRSFFSEPASFVIAMIPLQFLSLKRNDFKWSVFTTIAIALSTSSVGIVLSMVLWLYYLLKSNVSPVKKIALIVVAVIGVVAYLNLPLFGASLVKFQQALNGGNSFNMRITLGLDLIKAMDKKYIAFGTLYNEAFDYLKDNLSRFSKFGTTLYYYQFGREIYFINGFAQIIFRYGIVGFVLFFNIFRKKILSRKYEACALAIIFFVQGFFDTTLLNSYFFMIMTLLLCYDLKMNGITNV